MVRRPTRLAGLALAALLAAALPAPGARAATAPLAGLTVVLDAGHDGGNAAHPRAMHRQVPDGRGGHKDCDTAGTETRPGGYAEHAFAYDVVRRAAALLRAQGARVVLTRPDDRGVGPCVDVRGRSGNAVRADACVSVHADGGPSRGRGFHVVRAAHGRHTAADARLAAALKAAVQRDTGMRPADYVGGGTGLVQRDDLAGLQWSQRPKVLVELGNMRNARDALLLTDPAWRQRAAQALADAVRSFLHR